MLNHTERGRSNSRLQGIRQAIFSTDDVRSSQTYSFAIKRILDLVISGSILIIVALPMLLVMVLIKLDSPGSIFFKQTRIGLQGKPFKLIKLRTMVANAPSLQMSLEQSNEVEGGVLFKIKQDPRITRSGKFLRRYSIDEIPQLLNVIKGDMSLVGPRPLTLRDISKLPENEQMRHAVLPGITGLWQVSGRSETSSSSLGKCDRFYIQRWSLLLDFSILLKTVVVVFTCRGAY